MKFNEKIMSKINKTGTEGITKLVESMKKLEDDHVDLAQNQLEFEKYLKDILCRVKDIELMVKK